MNTCYKSYSEYKSSGIDWLGNVPEHWEVKRLKYLGKSIIGLTYSPNDIVENGNSGNLVLRASNIQNGKLDFNDNVYVKKDIPNKLITCKGDILICSRTSVFVPSTSYSTSPTLSFILKLDI